MSRLPESCGHLSLYLRIWKMISYGSVEVSIIFTINLFLSDHTGTLPIFSEKMVGHGQSQSWLQGIFIVYLIHIFQVIYPISRDIALPMHCNVKLSDFFMFFMWQFEVDIWMIYTFISKAMRFPFNFVKILKPLEFSIQLSEADPFLSSSKSQANWFHFQWPSSWKVQCIIWTI